MYSLSIYTPGILAEHLDSSVFEIQHTVRMASFWEDPVIKTKNVDPLKSEVLFVEEDFFEIFAYTPILGDLGTSLNHPESIVFTKDQAIRHFGNTDIIGETILLNNKYSFTVTAVIDQPASNTFLLFDALIPMKARSRIQSNEGEFTKWNWWNFHTFIQTGEVYEKEILENKIRNIFQQNSEREDGFKGIELLPVSDIYFSKIDSGWQDYFQTGNQNQVYVLAMVAFLILLIAIINFINISSSQYYERLKQAGIQKILGATKHHIIKQILLESSMLFVLSAWTAILFTEIIQVYLSQYLEIQFLSGLFKSFGLLVLIVFSSIILGILSSLSSAIVIGQSRSLDNLKKTVWSKTNKSVLRSILVISQFSIAIILIGFTILVQKQIHFGVTNLGYEKNNTVGIQFTQQLYGKQEVLKQSISEESFVSKVSMTQFFPGKDISQWGLEMNINGENQQVYFDIFDADPEFIDILDLKISSGRFFSRELETDMNTAVVNEVFMEANDIEDPIGLSIFGFGGEEFKIIGVVKNFHYEAVSRPIGPLVIRNSGNASICLVNLLGNDFNRLKENLGRLQDICKIHSPDFPVEIRFMDQAVERMYNNEIRFRRIFTLFSSSAIFISCLGILALSIFVCNVKTKEIGIRKTFGASIMNIFSMLNREFTRWVVVAFFIACPVSWYLMTIWLEGFSYKTSISWWIFSISGTLALGIAIISVSWQTYSSARKTPVDVLRHE